MDDLEDEILIEDDLDALDIIEFGFPRRFLRRVNYFEEMDNLTFFRRFRLMKETVLFLLPYLENDLEFNNDLNNSVAPINQLLATLRFYASVISFFSSIKSTSNQNTSFLGGEDAEVFRNRKGYFSINVQATCDADLKFLDVVARWPGSANDSTVFNNSRLKRRIENNEFRNGIFLGDSGYPLRNYFLTPLLNPCSPEERLYNEAHIRTRNTIERCFGVWKRRFPVVAYGMRLKLNNVMNVIVATAVLHNIALLQNEELPPPPDDVQVSEWNNLIMMANVPDLPLNNQNDNINAYRSELINSYFFNLIYQQ
ncbi:uncharacterized protein LOC123306405 [Coccinella septempunctata]|uniref:uncharacterized protein LOC123306405 n=1 Tax=Coccinella septempunctata TaxID=41139 RepID=UPI001D098BC0|nr:uncharacterized protein LOC123306405 [Coccinella septempunctata]